MGLPPSAVETIENRLRIDPAAMGLVFQPVKQQGLAASAGTTPFGVLFLAFSSFVIAAAVMLVALLFRLGDRCAGPAEVGHPAGPGLPAAAGRRAAGRRRACWWPRLGSLLGMAAGIGYAALMLAGLRTWWLAAVATPLLRLYVEPLSLVIGPAAGLAIAAITMFFSARRRRPRAAAAAPGGVDAEADRRRDAEMRRRGDFLGSSPGSRCGRSPTGPHHRPKVSRAPDTFGRAAAGSGDPPNPDRRTRRRGDA